MYTIYYKYIFIVRNCIPVFFYAFIGVDGDAFFFLFLGIGKEVWNRDEDLRKKNCCFTILFSFNVFSFLIDGTVFIHKAIERQEEGDEKKM